MWRLQSGQSSGLNLSINERRKEISLQLQRRRGWQVGQNNTNFLDWNSSDASASNDRRQNDIYALYDGPDEPVNKTPKPEKKTKKKKEKSEKQEKREKKEKKKKEKKKKKKTSETEVVIDIDETKADVVIKIDETIQTEPLPEPEPVPTRDVETGTMDTDATTGVLWEHLRDQALDLLQF